MNYYILLDNDKETNNHSFEFAAVGAAIGGSFDHTRKLIPKKYKEAMMGCDKEKWTKSVNKEHERKVQDGVFKVVDAKDAISYGQKAITSTWTMKKKSNGTFCSHLVAREFQQQEGLHYNIVAISSPVTNNTSICMVLIIMVVAGNTARVINVKAAFLSANWRTMKKST